MDSQQTAPLHPLLKVAAGSVIVASLAVVANMAGLFPKSHDAPPAPAAAVVATPANPPATASVAAVPAPAAPEPVLQPVPAPAAKPAPKVVEEREPAPVVKKHRTHTVSYEEPRPTPAASICYSCGTVQSVNVVTDAGQASGAGAVTGAVLGGVAGHQMGKGKGKDAMTIVGVIGGALAGNATEKAIKKSQHYEVTVRMEDGNMQTFNFENVPPFSSGDAVRVDGGQLMRR